MQLSRVVIGATAVATLMVAAAQGAVARGAHQERTLADGVYTEEQAKRGADVYERACQECHAADEYEGFLRRWEGLPVSFFYEIVRSTMPQDNPGGLSRDEYADVLAYVFSINGAPTGDEEMGSAPESLDAITITVPPEGG